MHSPILDAQDLMYELLIKLNFPFWGNLTVAHSLKITDTHARSGGKMATSGATSKVNKNTFDTKDRFI